MESRIVNIFEPRFVEHGGAGGAEYRRLLCHWYLIFELFDVFIRKDESGSLGELDHGRGDFFGIRNIGPFERALAPFVTSINEPDDLLSRDQRHQKQRRVASTFQVIGEWAEVLFTVECGRNALEFADPTDHRILQSVFDRQYVATAEAVLGGEEKLVAWAVEI